MNSDPMPRDRSAEGGIDMGAYTAALEREGIVACVGTKHLWRRGEFGSLERDPPVCCDVPDAREIRRVFWKKWPPVITYVRNADDLHPANAWLYLCENREYCLEGLASPARRDARRALRTFRYEFLEPAVFLEQGAGPYCDTRARVGLSDGTPEHFRKHAAHLISNPGYKFVGAWHEDRLAAYMWMLMVEDWAAIGAYAANDHLRSCPNNGLVHFALDHCLTQRRCRIVTYGLSSVQEVSRAATLDYFKKKVGFEARPVHRVFAVHPLLRPIVNPVTYWGLRSLSRLWPGNRLLRKGTGLLAAQLGYQHPLAGSTAEMHGDQFPSSSGQADSP